MKNTWFQDLRNSLNNFFGEGTFSEDETPAEVEQKLEDMAAEKNEKKEVVEGAQANTAELTAEAPKAEAQEEAAPKSEDKEEDKVAQMEAKIAILVASNAEMEARLSNALSNVQTIVAQGFEQVGTALNTLASGVKAAEVKTDEKITSLATRINNIASAKSGGDGAFADRFEHGDKNNEDEAKEGVGATYQKKENGGVVMVGGSALDSLVN